ncbi:alpha-glucuronidase [Draconibacterium halophilum]|uniref:Alpha-glucuronidase n=1 Tax=Draconibacterium halophilum TaxID=2706887 RepID=A0A6C0RCL6_9BACT|nr:alpha-glucuronidase [Draconibacterium halophilum]QIA08080.1 alpha-glucuronidase [Draconibacterium halophilum]
MKTTKLILILILFSTSLFAENDSELWLRKKATTQVNIQCSKSSPTIDIAINELKNSWQGEDGANIELKIIKDKQLKADGFRLSRTGIQAKTDAGLLYGVFEILRRQQTGGSITGDIVNPSYDLRLLNHWDNLNGSVERGYAGRSIFWRGIDSLEVTSGDLNLWKEYARANASVGINATVLNNVNASPSVLTTPVLERAKAVADVLRPYGIKTYLAVNFASPEVIGGLETADPFDPAVKAWWKEKVKEIYTLIPDFGGFLVKANSEGQPGPQNFGRNHADGANMMAEALEPYNGIVMWRAFVYDPSDEDRAKQAYNEFMPLDGQFHDNVIIQVKNGPIDFQPREPFSPLFGAMKKTTVMPELQVTMEYLGQSVHLVFLATMWEEFLKSETWQEGAGSTVARCTDGSIFNQKYSAIAGVANIGLDANWCGHDFAQANWYAFGRQAWDHSISSAQIADEWLKLTFGPQNIDKETSSYDLEWNLSFLQPVKQMMLNSHEATVNYMMPLGLHHIFSAHAHYGPGPWWAPRGMRADWTPPYYHQADSLGIGFDRTASGSDAISQYHEPLAGQLADLNTCPEVYLLWFHHVSWDHKMKNNRTLWNELCYRYDEGVKQVREFQQVWDKAERFVDAERFAAVQHKLTEQGMNAQEWKDACLLYFQQFSKQPIPYELERPLFNLDELLERDRQRVRRSR